MKDKLPTFQEMVNMDLHVQLTFPDFMITRVPGGWLYSHFRDVYGTSVFVPHNKSTFEDMMYETSF